ncbi:hypothetical protein PPROV_000992800 [Pycnococcus provasolii]|uniref:Uncharacterized protein n=2 Tax=Pycnococcus provasolii TaxID=41880 RepID=A0A830HW76_9CHLO|nr:hypothetical protein PPROV_000992800 [Pycnococcus provasolii]
MSASASASVDDINNTSGSSALSLSRSRTLGNASYALREYEDAIGFYTNAITLADPPPPASSSSSPPASSSQHHQLAQVELARCFANRSAAYLKTVQKQPNNLQLALEDAKKAADYDPAWAKAHMRVGAAYTTIEAPPCAAVAYAKAARAANAANDNKALQEAETACVTALAASFAGLGLRRQLGMSQSAPTSEDLEAVLAPGGVEAIVEAFFVCPTSHAIAAASMLQVAVLAVSAEHKRTVTSPLTREVAMMRAAAAAALPNPLASAAGARLTANQETAELLVNACMGKSPLDAIAMAAGSAPLGSDGRGDGTVAASPPLACKALNTLCPSRLGSPYESNTVAFAATSALANLLEGAPAEVSREVARHAETAKALQRVLAFMVEAVPSQPTEAGLDSGTRACVELTAEARAAAAALSASRRMAEHADGDDAQRMWDLWNASLLTLAAPSEAFVAAANAVATSDVDIADDQEAMQQFLMHATHEGIRVGSAFAALGALARASDAAAAAIFDDERNGDLSDGVLSTIEAALIAVPTEAASAPCFSLIALAARRGTSAVRGGAVGRITAYEQVSLRPRLVAAIRELASTAPPASSYGRHVRAVGPSVRAEARTALRKVSEFL